MGFGVEPLRGKDLVGERGSFPGMQLRGKPQDISRLSQARA
jgi:hypothetical protein